MTRIFARLVSLLAILWWVLAPRVAFGEPLRILVAASHPQGRSGERPLKHADGDARSVRDAFVRIGDVRPENAFLLQRPSADELLHALDHAARIAGAHGSDDVTLVFYFSGHGDGEAIHLGEERLPIDVIESRLGAAGAGLRIVVIDACRTNDGRAKGFTDGDPFAVALPTTATAKGSVRLHASADGEVAQESDELGGAVFTHYWVNGLMGAADANNDGQVTLGESYAYAYQQTLWRSSVSSGVPQRPSAVVDLREASPLVLTRTDQSSAIVFPLSADTHYVIYGLGSQTVVGDLWGSPDHAVKLAVGAGHYVVHRRGSGTSSAAEVAVARGEAYVVSPGEFVAFSEEALALKGGTLVLHPNEIELGYSAQAPDRLVSFGEEGELRFTRAWDRWAVSGGAHAGAGASDTTYWNAKLRWLGGDVLAERRFSLGWPTLRLGAGVVVDYVHQKLERADAAALAGTPYATESRHDAVEGGGRVIAGVRFPFTPRVWIDTEARVDLLATEIAGGDTLFLRASARAAMGWSF